MAVDATGTPTSPDSIPTFNTAVDPPSGKGFNAAMAAIQTIVTQLKAGTLASGKIAIAALAGYPADATKVLKGDGTWGSTTSDFVKLYDSTDAGVSFPTASITTPALPQTYKHLRVIVSGRSDPAGTRPQVQVRCNSDAGANYDWSFAGQLNGVFASGGAGAADTKAVLGVITGATSPASATGIVDFTITAYRDLTLYKAMSGTTYSPGDGTIATGLFAGFAGAEWRSTAAISTLNFTSSGPGNFVAGTRITVYGMN